jgi:hypothetical protein
MRLPSTTRRSRMPRFVYRRIRVNCCKPQCRVIVWATVSNRNQPARQWASPRSFSNLVLVPIRGARLASREEIEADLRTLNIPHGTSFAPWPHARACIALAPDPYLSSEACYHVKFALLLFKLC